MSGRMLDYWEIVDERRKLPVPKGGHYKTLAQVGLDGLWVSPIQMTSDSRCGPVLVANNFLGWEEAIERRPEVLRYGGYLPDIPFNRVLDLALWQAGVHRRDIYVTQVVHLLPQETSGVGRDADLEQECFERVTLHELRRRRVIALGDPAKEWCRKWHKDPETGFDLVCCLDHPSARTAEDRQERANELTKALCKATHRGRRARAGSLEKVASVWQLSGDPVGWPPRPERTGRKK